MLAVAATLAVGGCRASTKPKPTPSPAPEEERPEVRALRIEVDVLVAALETQRGLKRRTPVAVGLADAAEFASGVRSRVDRLPDKVFADWQLPLVAFGLLEPQAPDRANAQLSEFAEAQVLAFYDYAAKRVVARREMPRELLAIAPGVRRTLLAHEIGHKLQDDAFDLSKFFSAGAGDFDASFARRALVEGDATLMTVLVEGPPGQADLDRIVTRVEELPPDFFTAILGAANEGTPRVVRDGMALPYTAGVAFAAALWRSGGPELLNAAYGSPPVSSAQIFHPELYLRGVRPRTIELARVASLERDEYVPLAEGSLGEAGLRSLMADALGGRSAAEMAQGANGDRYRVYHRDKPEEANSALALAWTVCFSTEVGAREFATAAATMFSRRWTTADKIPGVPWVSGNYVLRRQGDCVFVVRGGPKVGLPAAIAQLAVSKTTLTPGLPPVSGVPFVAPGKLEEATVASRAQLPDLLAAIDLPPGRWQLQVGPPQSALVAKRTDGFGALTVAVQPLASPDDVGTILAATNRAVAAGLQGEIPGATAKDSPTTVEKTPLGQGSALVTKVRNADGSRVIVLRSLGVPVCGGRAMVLVSTMGPAATAESLAEAVRRMTVRPGEAPVCRTVGPSAVR